jgi:hypothetical protein
MSNRNTGIIATIASVVLCGCPGLFLCIFGALTATGNMPYSTELNGITNTGTMPSTSGYVMLCLAVILIIIPFAVGFFTLRKKPVEASSSETVPPAS